MDNRRIPTLIAVFGVGLGLAGCLSQTHWASEQSLVGASEAPATTRSELERRRSEGLAATSPDSEALGDYLVYLWQFDWEHRAYLDRVDAGESPKLPESLSGYDRATYTREALDAWASVRPASLPSSGDRLTLARMDFRATLLERGCLDSKPAFGPLLVLRAELLEPPSVVLELAMLATECAEAPEDVLEDACVTAAGLIQGMPEPEYDDLDGDMWPDPSLRVRFAESCGRQMAEEDKAIVASFWSGAEPWFAEHHPEEHRAWREEQARLAELARQREEARRQAQAEADAAAAAAAAAAPSSSGGSASAGSSRVTVNLYNNCPNTVKLFFGDNPGFSSGTSTSLSANTSTNYYMDAGDLMWITEGGKGVSSYSASSNVSLQITSSCTGFAPR